MINVGETVRVTAKPYDWDGEFDQLAVCSFTIQREDVTLDPAPMAFSEGLAAFVGSFTPQASGEYQVRITALLSDGTKSIERRKIVVRS